MDEKEYLKQHHHITESAIGLISFQKDMDGVHKVVIETQDKLKALLLVRLSTLCEEKGSDFQLTKCMFGFDK